MSTDPHPDRKFENHCPTCACRRFGNVAPVKVHRNEPLIMFFCIDLTHAVLDEAMEAKADVIIAYHPPISGA